LPCARASRHDASSKNVENILVLALLVSKTILLGNLDRLMDASEMPDEILGEIGLYSELVHIDLRRRCLRRRRWGPRARGPASPCRRTARRGRARIVQPRNCPLPAPVHTPKPSAAASPACAGRRAALGVVWQAVGRERRDALAVEHPPFLQLELGQVLGLRQPHKLLERQLAQRTSRAAQPQRS